MLEEVFGQTEGVQFLRRVISRQFTMPLLLVGPSGTGRKFSVLAAAKEMVSEDESQVYQVASGCHPDIIVVTPEPGKEIKVDTIRDLLERAKFQPSRAPYRFLVVDGIDRATVAASNALLKVLEEAPDLVRFFLLAEREDTVLPTIRSRCTVVRYQRLPEKFVQQLLQYHTENDARALVCSRLAEGSVGRAIRYLNKLSLRDDMLGLLSLGLRHDMKALFAAVDAVEDDLPTALCFIEHILCDLTMLPHTPSLIANADRADVLLKLREQMGVDRIESFRSELRRVQSRVDLPLNLAFHVKAMLASAF